MRLLRLPTCGVRSEKPAPCARAAEFQHAGTHSLHAAKAVNQVRIQVFVIGFHVAQTVGLAVSFVRTYMAYTHGLQVSCGCTWLSRSPRSWSGCVVGTASMRIRCESMSSRCYQHTNLTLPYPAIPYQNPPKQPAQAPHASNHL